MENAIKFSYVNSSISITCSVGDQWVQVSIRDFGIGIAEKDIETIFEKFRTLPSSRGTGGTKGTGLGLTICQKIIEAHKGRIWAESRKGQGSVFHFTIPKEYINELDEDDLIEPQEDLSEVI